MGGAGAEGAGAVPELRAARQRGRAVEGSRRATLEGGGGAARAGADGAGGGGVVRPGTDGDRAFADAPRGSARPRVVRASDLRAREVHRLRREDAAGRARGDRAAEVG